METQLADPIHHALQMRTPLQLRFCNPWHVVSDYRMEIHLGENRVISVRLTGATVASPNRALTSPVHLMTPDRCTPNITARSHG
jgi:hypothetical protein